MFLPASFYTTVRSLSVYALVCFFFGGGRGIESNIFPDSEDGTQIESGPDSFGGQVTESNIFPGS